MKPDDRKRFDALRARYLTAKRRRDEFDAALAARYGGDFRDSWLGSGDRNRRQRLRASLDKAGDALFDHLRSFSPRDWSVGVPACWVYESLTFEDAARPKSEPLSVVPPLSYGSTVPLT